MSTGKIKTRVSSTGKKIRRKFCAPGFKYDSTTKSCKRISASEKVSKRKSIRKALRTKRADSGGKKRAVRKRLKAMRKRKAMGL
jgi:hypothetical protein